MAARKGSGFPFPAQPDPPSIGEWKIQMNLRVPPDFRRNFEAFAEKERRKPGALAYALLEWAFEQLQTAGSLTNLLKFHLAKRKLPPS